MTSAQAAVSGAAGAMCWWTSPAPTPSWPPPRRRWPGTSLCFGGADGAVVVCDATCLERNLNLVLQTLDPARTVVCVNLLDEAERKGVRVELELSRRLGARGGPPPAGEGLEALMAAVEGDLRPGAAYPCSGALPAPVEFAVASLGPCWSRLRAASPPAGRPCTPAGGDGAFLDRLSAALEWDPGRTPLWGGRGGPRRSGRQGLGGGAWCERVVSALVETAEAIGAASVTSSDPPPGGGGCLPRHRHPLMLLLLAGCCGSPSPGPTTPPSCPTACSGCRTG